MIAVLDYGMGNLRSVRQAFRVLGEDVTLVTRPEELAAADRIILPGVGAFGACVKNLRESKMIEALEENVRKKAKPFLGICLGMQMLASRGEEDGDHEGLGWIPGRVRRLDVDTKAKLNVPHMGWNDVEYPQTSHPLFAGLTSPACYYFVHSYVFEPENKADTAGVCNYGGPFTCAVLRDNMFATQFHPEKSQREGLELLKRWLEWKP